MRIGDGEAALTIGSETLRLRPTLRTAMVLHRRYDGFTPILQAVAAQNVSVIADVLSTGSLYPTTVPRLISEIGSMPLHSNLPVISNTTLMFVLALAGIEPDAPPTAEATANPLSFEEHFTRLFEIGTGWLGWTPEDTWNATPAEILAAHRGRVSLLTAIFGDGKSDTPATYSDTRDENAFARLKAMGNRG